MHVVIFEFKVTLSNNDAVNTSTMHGLNACYSRVVVQSLHPLDILVDLLRFQQRIEIGLHAKRRPERSIPLLLHLCWVFEGSLQKLSV